jgi:hypothetical protein
MFVTARGTASVHLFPSPSPTLPTHTIPHGLVEHKARSILDPALYSERYIKHLPLSRLLAQRVGGLPAPLERLLRRCAIAFLTKCSAPASVCLFSVLWMEADGVYEVGGSWCLYISRFMWGLG